MYKNNNSRQLCGDIHWASITTQRPTGLQAEMPVIPFITAALVKASLQLCDSIQVEGLEHIFTAFAQGRPILTSESKHLGDNMILHTGRLIHLLYS